MAGFKDILGVFIIVYIVYLVLLWWIWWGVTNNLNLSDNQCTLLDVQLGTKFSSINTKKLQDAKNLANVFGISLLIFALAVGVFFLTKIKL